MKDSLNEELCIHCIDSDSLFCYRLRSQDLLTVQRKCIGSGWINSATSCKVVGENKMNSLKMMQINIHFFTKITSHLFIFDFLLVCCTGWLVTYVRKISSTTRIPNCSIYSFSSSYKRISASCFKLSFIISVGVFTTKHSK